MSPWFPHSSIWPRWLRFIELNVRMRVFKQNSYLIDNWTIIEGEMETMHGLDLEDKLAKILTEEIEKRSEMTKIRRLEITTNGSGFTFIVGGKLTEGDDAEHLIETMNNYQNELDDIDGTIDIIMRSLRTTHDLSNDEYADYEHTLKYFLKD